MNHNLLISKYLDGDLTHEEDNEFRRLLSENSAIKEEFDSATMLHFLMKEDAESIVPPADFILQTEELLLGKYANVPNEFTASQKPTSGNTVRNFTTAVAILLFLFVLPFGDNSQGLIDSFADSSVQIDSNSNDESTSTRSITYTGNAVHHNKVTSISKNNLQLATSKSSSAISQALDSNMPSSQSGLEGNSVSAVIPTETTPEIDLQVPTQGNQSAQNVITPSMAVSKENSSAASSVQTQKIHVPGTGLFISAFQPMLPYIQSEQSNPAEIQVSTFVSTMITLPSNYTNATSTFSQSIAYSLNDNNRVGMEVGYFGYTYQDGGTVLVPRSGAIGTSSKTLGMDDPAPGANDASIERSSLNMSTGFDERKVEYSLDKNMYWGAAFYERTIFNSGKVSFNGRVGVGGSSDGPMAFSRAFARYSVFSGVALTLGAEANAFMIHAPMISGKQFDVSSGVSLVYGMQIKF